MTLFGIWIASLLPGLDGTHGLYLGGALAISSSAILLNGPAYPQFAGAKRPVHYLPGLAVSRESSTHRAHGRPGRRTTPLSLLLLIAPMLTMGIIGFRIHRVLEPSFSEPFIAEPAPAESDCGGSGHTFDEDAPAETGPDHLVLGVIERLGEQTELLQILEDKAASQREGNDAVAEKPPTHPAGICNEVKRPWQ